MSRSLYTVQVSSTGEDLGGKINTLLGVRGFTPISYNDEPNVFKRGKGFLTAPQYVQYRIAGNQVEFYGWVKPFILFGESDLTGFAGSIPKQKLAKLINEVMTEIAAPAKGGTF